LRADFLGAVPDNIKAALPSIEAMAHNPQALVDPSKLADLKTSFAAMGPQGASMALKSSLL